MSSGPLLCNRIGAFFLPVGIEHTEKLFAATTFLNDLDQAGLQLFDRWDVLCEDTHLSGFCCDVDLDTIGERVSK